MRTDDSKKHNPRLMKLTSTPLLNSIMASPNEDRLKKADNDGENVMSFLAKATEKKGSYRSNYYKELFADPLDQSPTYLKTDKGRFYDSSKMEVDPDELETIRDDVKPQYGYVSSISRSNSKYL